MNSSPKLNPPAAFSPPRVAPNLAHAWGGIWRLTFRRLLMPAHWLMLGIALGVLVLLAMGGTHRGGTDRVLEWSGSFYATFLVPALAFMAAGGVMRDEMKSGNVDYVLTRPIPRSAFVGFKFLAHLICMQLDFLFALVLLMIFAATREVPGLALFALKLGFGQALMITAFSALGFLCGAITSRYVIIGLAYAGLIEAGVGQIPTQISRLSMTHQVRDLLALLFNRAEATATSPGFVGTSAVVFVFTILMLGATAAIFTLRELSGPNDV